MLIAAGVICSVASGVELLTKFTLRQGKYIFLKKGNVTDNTLRLSKLCLKSLEENKMDKNKDKRITDTYTILQEKKKSTNDSPAQPQ